MNFKPRNAQNDNAGAAAATSAVKRAESGDAKAIGTLGKLAIGATLLLPSAGLMLIPANANADTCAVQRIRRNIPAPTQMSAVVLGADNAVVVRVRDGAGRGVHIALTIPSSVSAPVLESIAGKEAEAQRAALSGLIMPNLQKGTAGLVDKGAGAKSYAFDCVVPESGEKPTAKPAGKKPKAPAAMPASGTLTKEGLANGASAIYINMVRSGALKPVPGKLSIRVVVGDDGRATRIVGAMGEGEFKNMELIKGIAGLLSRYTFPDAARGRTVLYGFDFTAAAEAAAKMPVRKSVDGGTSVDVEVDAGVIAREKAKAQGAAKPAQAPPANVGPLPKLETVPWNGKSADIARVLRANESRLSIFLKSAEMKGADTNQAKAVLGGVGRVLMAYAQQKGGAPEGVLRNVLNVAKRSLEGAVYEAQRLRMKQGQSGGKTSARPAPAPYYAPSPGQDQQSLRAAADGYINNSRSLSGTVKSQLLGELKGSKTPGIVHGKAAKLEDTEVGPLEYSYSPGSKSNLGEGTEDWKSVEESILRVFAKASESLGLKGYPAWITLRISVGKDSRIAVMRVKKGTNAYTGNREFHAELFKRLMRYSFPEEKANQSFDMSFSLKKR